MYNGKKMKSLAMFFEKNARSMKCDIECVENVWVLSEIEPTTVNVCILKAIQALKYVIKSCSGVDLRNSFHLICMS